MCMTSRAACVFDNLPYVKSKIIPGFLSMARSTAAVVQSIVSLIEEFLCSGGSQFYLQMMKCMI